MSMEFEYYGQNDGTVSPDVLLTGDPAVDQGVLKAAGYYGGKIMALYTSMTAGRGVVVVPCNGANQTPYGVLINGAGNYAESIGPSGSKKTPVVRAFAKIKVSNEGTNNLVYETTPTVAYTVGALLYAGDGTTAAPGTWTTDKAVGALNAGICTHIPTGTEPWLGVAMLF
jgi:hypothetical protein